MCVDLQNHVLEARLSRGTRQPPRCRATRLELATWPPRLLCGILMSIVYSQLVENYARASFHSSFQSSFPALDDTLPPLVVTGGTKPLVTMTSQCVSVFDVSTEIFVLRRRCGSISLARQQEFETSHPSLATSYVCFTRRLRGIVTMSTDESKILYGLTSYQLLHVRRTT